MLLNIAHLAGPALFGDFGGEGRAITNPTIDGFITPFGNAIDGLPAWPIFETLVVVILVAGAIYYAVSVRGRAADVERLTPSPARRRSARPLGSSREESVRRGERSSRRSSILDAQTDRQ